MKYGNMFSKAKEFSSDSSSSSLQSSLLPKNEKLENEFDEYSNYDVNQYKTLEKIDEVNEIPLNEKNINLEYQNEYFNIIGEVDHIPPNDQEEINGKNFNEIALNKGNKPKMLFNVMKTGKFENEMTSPSIKKTYFTTIKKDNQELIKVEETEDIKKKKIRADDLRVSYMKSFFKSLVIFINNLIEIFNIKNGKNLNYFSINNNNLYIKHGANDIIEILKNKAKDVLSVESSNGDNYNIKLIISIINENENKPLIKVLNKTIKELMDIYRDKIIPEEDYYQYFPRFKDFVKNWKNLDEEKREVLIDQGMNFEEKIKKIIDFDCKPGPKAKKIK